jgi:GNAT superfamily N-acetyltransferase
MRREVAGDVVRLVHTEADGEGSMIYSRLDESRVEAAIGEQVAYFEGIGQKFEWKVFDYDTPADLKERLAAHGFEVEDPDAIMVLDLDAVWDGDYSALGRSLAHTLAHHPHLLSVYVAYVDEVPASAGWIMLRERSQFGSLWGGSTLSEYRGRGLYTALLGARAQEARERQVRYLTVDASPMSRPILEKFGFEVIAFAYACKWKM